jgi:hypothetical protein
MADGLAGGGSVGLSLAARDWEAIQAFLTGE